MAAAPNDSTVPGFCECGDAQARLAVLGVFSQDTAENAALRTASRDTWMRPSLGGGILSLFVMRGIGLSARALQEARAHGDTVFVSAPSTTSYKTAPLHSLLGWLRCAHAAWPRARLIGKADDDVAVMAVRVALHLRATLTALERPSAGEALGRRRQRPRLVSPLIFWGLMETMHWDVHTHRPAHQFRFGFGFRGQLSPNCLRRRSPPGYAWRNGSFFTNKARKLYWRAPSRNSEEALLPAHAADVWRDEHTPPPPAELEALPAGLFVGPLPYAKGPLYFMSRELAAQLSADVALRREAGATISSARNTTYREPLWPWEDIFTGLALTQVARSPQPTQPLVAVHIGGDAFLESFSLGRGRQLVLKETMLLWHDRAKLTTQMRTAFEWAHVHGCNTSSLRLTCSEATSCAGAEWWFCSAHHKDTSYERPGCSAVLRRADGRATSVPRVASKRRGNAKGPRLRATEADGANARGAAAGKQAGGGWSGGSVPRAAPPPGRGAIR